MSTQPPNLPDQGPPDQGPPVEGVDRAPRRAWIAVAAGMTLGFVAGLGQESGSGGLVLTLLFGALAAALAAAGLVVSSAATALRGGRAPVRRLAHVVALFICSAMLAGMIGFVAAG